MTRILVSDVDRQLAQTVRRVAPDRVEVLAIETIGHASDALSDCVLVAGSAYGTQSGIAELHEFHVANPSVPIVLAFDRGPYAGMREVVSVGADALVDPTDDGELRRALAIALQRAQLTVTNATTTPAITHGSVIALVSAAGGCGKSFIASSLAVALATWTDAQVVLVDLDLAFGDLPISLGLRTHVGWADLAGAGSAEVASFLEGALTVHDTGVRLLAGPQDPVAAESVDAKTVRASLEHLRERYDFVIVDNPTGLSELTLEALQVADQVVVPFVLDVPGIRSTRVLDSTLDHLGFDERSRHLIVNEDRPDAGVTADEVERALGRALLARIPYVEQVQRTINEGRPVVTDRGSGIVVNPLVDVVATIVDVHQASWTINRKAPKRRRWGLRQRGRAKQESHEGTA